MTATSDDLVAAFLQVFGEPPYRLPLDPATYEDYSDQRPGLSKSARRQQRRPLPIKVDEYGYDQRGRYWGEPDEVAS